jgi:hypothetical protein
MLWRVGQRPRQSPRARRRPPTAAGSATCATSSTASPCGCDDPGLLHDLAGLLPSVLDADDARQVADRAARAPDGYKSTDQATTAGTTMTTDHNAKHPARAPDEELRTAVAESVRLLHRFADYHEAADKAAFLQRCDPDLAIAIRRIWQPEDAEQDVTNPRTAKRRGR